MSLTTKLLLTTGVTVAVLLVAALLLKKYTPKYDFAFPLLVSVVALAISLVSAFKNELFDFKLHVVPGEVTLAVPTLPSHRSFAIIYSLSFINQGYGHGIVEWVALKVHGPDGTKLYTPVAEINYEKFLQGKRQLHSENISGAFGPFILGSKEASKHFILLAQAENNPKYPFKEWREGKYRFEVWVKTSNDSRPRAMHIREWDIPQRMIDAYFRGEGTVLIDQHIDL